MKSHTPAVFFLVCPAGFDPGHIFQKFGRILDRLNAASDIIDIYYPGSYLHKLAGDLEGQYSVRVSGNWRISSSS